MKVGRMAFGQTETTLAMKEGPSGELAASLRDALAANRATMDQSQETLSLQDVPAVQLIGDFGTTAGSAQTTFKKAQETLATAKGIVDENSSLRYELRNILEELSAAARSIRHMAEYLERHQEALIHGKWESREN